MGKFILFNLFGNNCDSPDVITHLFYEVSRNNAWLTLSDTCWSYNFFYCWNYSKVPMRKWWVFIYICFVCMKAHNIYKIINILWSWVNKIDLYRYVLEVCLYFKNQIPIFDIYFVFINHRDESQDYFDKVRISDFPKRYMLTEQNNSQFTDVSNCSFSLSIYNFKFEDIQELGSWIYGTSPSKPCSVT